MFELGVGWALLDGLILGGRVLGVRADQETYYHPSGVTQYQGFIDLYPTSQGNIHVQAGFGASVVTFPYNLLETSKKSGFTIGMGGETWIGDDWGLGGMLNLQWDWCDSVPVEGATTPGGITPFFLEAYHGHVFTPSLMLTVTYN